MKFLFPSSGTYSVTVRADNGHLDSITKKITIGIITKAAFSFQRCTNQFVNISSCASGYFWNFGDNSTSKNALPVHQYADTGYYSITLIVSNGQSADTLTQSLHIDALGYCSSDFTFIQSNDTIFFHASDSIVDYYSWSFGDNTYATGRDTMHVYTTPATYKVTLLTQNQCGINFSDPVEIYASIFEQVLGQFNNIAIFPNPASNHVTIQSSNGMLIGANVSLQNILGEEIMKVKSKSNYMNLNLSPYLNGVYFMNIVTDAGSAVKKIVVSK